MIDLDSIKQTVDLCRADPLARRETNQERQGL